MQENGTPRQLHTFKIGYVENNTGELGESFPFWFKNTLLT